MANGPVPSVAPVGESRGLTGLRAVGASLVVLHHFYLHFGTVPHEPTFMSFAVHGYLGVDLFFILSGFVMAMVYGPGFAGGAPASPLAQVHALIVFLWRRAARLWPAHAVMLAIVIAIEAGHGLSHTPLNILANFAMIQAWGDSRTINVPSWSVSTEWLAYLVFPLLAPLLLGRRLGPMLGCALGTALAAALLAAAIATAAPIGSGRRGLLDLYANASLLPVARCLAGFTLGVATWALTGAPSVTRLLANAWAGPAALCAVLVLTYAGDDLAAYALMPVAVLGIHLGHGPAWRLLATGPIHRLGVLSYALYLVHYTFLAWFPFGAGPLWLGLVVYMLATYGAALLLHLLVELPCRRAVRAFGEAATLRTLRRLAAPPPLQRGPG